MYVAVTGASGRIGSEVARQLVAAGHRVLGIDRVPPTAAPAGTEHLVCDLADLAPADPRLAGVEAVAHLGAYMSWREEDARALFEANVTGTFALLQAVEGLPLSRFVLASTGDVYPETTAAPGERIDEDHPRLATGHYGLSKIMAEEVVQFAHRRGVPTVTLRFCHTQDPAELLDETSFFSGPRFFLHPRLDRARAAGDTALVQQLEAADAGPDTLIAVRRADGSPARMGILATADLAAGVVLALTRPDVPSGAVIGLGPDQPLDLADFVGRLAAAASLPVVDVTVPAAPSYATSNQRACELLGFRVGVDVPAMVEAAALARKERLARLS
ncbi:NAD-dependent epimerase/dehydratase family protein [Microlunatus sp. GCM10028923]|uniref:NAD-dependent epimerase/dehydratase family protein n=1 Tax=Microlunatus sp. GCM10028923 TaxID=3273400 RepID=UPI00360AF72D